MAPEDDDDKMDDGRETGDFKTRYEGAWCQIILETIYLLLILGCLFLFIYWCSNSESLIFNKIFNKNYNELSETSKVLLAFWASGSIGGTISALKYHYHVVGVGKWNRDRVVWRVVSPIIAGVLASMIGMLLHSGVLVLSLSSETDNQLARFVGLGFIIGLFADSAIAKLQELTRIIFGLKSD